MKENIHHILWIFSFSLTTTKTNHKKCTFFYEQYECFLSSLKTFQKKRKKEEKYEWKIIYKMQVHKNK